eukprot:6195609-Pleurochrysis_carterae.AAC.1
MDPGTNHGFTNECSLCDPWEAGGRAGLTEVLKDFFPLVWHGIAQHGNQQSVHLALRSRARVKSSALRHTAVHSCFPCLRCPSVTSLFSHRACSWFILARPGQARTMAPMSHIQESVIKGGNGCCSL